MCPAWSIPGYLEVRNDHLTVNGVDTLELVKEFNSPLFVFSEGRILDNIKRLQRAADAVDRPIKFCYASKANSNMAILKVVLESGIDIEVNSGGELFKALRVGFRPEQIIFNGTSKSDDELDDAVRAGIYAINVDSIYEIDLVEQSVERLRARGENVPPARITLRLVPEIGTRSHLGLQTALLTSKFGISSSEVLAAFRRGLEKPDLVHVCGIHIHVGSQTPELSEACGNTSSRLIARRATRSSISISAVAFPLTTCAIVHKQINFLNTSATCWAQNSSLRPCSKKRCASHANQRVLQTLNICSIK